MVVKVLSFSAGKRTKIAVTLLLLSLTCGLQGQESVYSIYYRVYFRDKGDNDIANFSASEILSSRALSRREKVGISVPDLKDISVLKEYLDQISELGFKLHCPYKC